MTNRHNSSKYTIHEPGRFIHTETVNSRATTSTTAATTVYMYHIYEPPPPSEKKTNKLTNMPKKMWPFSYTDLHVLKVPKNLLLNKYFHSSLFWQNISVIFFHSAPINEVQNGNLRKIKTYLIIYCSRLEVWGYSFYKIV